MKTGSSSRWMAALCVASFLAMSCASRGAVIRTTAPGAADAGGSPSIAWQDVRPGPGVTGQRWLSDYVSGLKNGPGDSPVYILDSGRPGGTLLVIGGTHANEIAGMTAATLMVEKAMPTAGRIVIIPHLNSSGLSYVDAAHPQPPRIRVEAASGTRFLAYGSRLVHPEHQGRSDPARYTLPDSKESLPGEEQRNINRAYPGQPDGPLAQRIAAAVMAIIHDEKVAIAVDMHEARPTSKLVWMIVANPKNVGIAVNTIFDLEDKDILMKLDQSSEEFRGLSHREWGDRSDALAFLVETVNPAQDPAAGTVLEQLGHPLFPLWKRVAVQLEALAGLVANFNLSAGAESVEYHGTPGYDELEAQGLEAFL